MKKDPKKLKHRFKPESLMMSYGYDPELSEGAIKCPIFQTSTFVFDDAAHGKAFFEIANDIRKQKPNEELGLIYSRLNNPDLEILEDRLTVWEGAEEAAVFESGMSAITTVLLEFLQPGNLLLYSRPIYGGTDYFIKHILPKFGIQTLGMKPNLEEDDIHELLQESGMADELAMIYVETPANPTNDLIDLECCRKIADHYSGEDRRVLLSVDNTYLGPVWQHPIEFGANLVLYSATKFIGGHSDLIAGACLGSAELMKRVKTMRTFLGNMAGPWTGWLLMRSLETMKLRMEKQVDNAHKVAEYLIGHPAVEKVYYLGTLEGGDSRQAEIYRKQCLSSGSMVSFDIAGGEEEAFQFLDHLKLIQLAVSLGGTESLAQHPASMTHSDVDPVEREELSITDQMVRLSIGVEDPDDLIWDLEQAFESVGYPEGEEYQSVK
ncbi:MAG: cystathionine gamma-synthase family protein [Balneolaceae bacterium]|nr:cystathionine gamma-synthase family protein [Balneolaceae bacterium]